MRKSVSPDLKWSRQKQSYSQTLSTSRRVFDGVSIILTYEKGEINANNMDAGDLRAVGSLQKGDFSVRRRCGNDLAREFESCYKGGGVPE